MKKYLLFLIAFFALGTPVFAKGSSIAQPSTQTNSTSSPQPVTGSNTQSDPTQKPLISPTGNQVKNQNHVQTQNQGESQQLTVKTQEVEQLNQEVTDSVTKVSYQILQLIDTVGAKGGIGQQVKDIAQSQTKTQQEIKSDFDKINDQSKVLKFFLGSDKKLVQSLSQKLEQNQLMIQQLEQLKAQTKNKGDLEQLQ